MERFKALQVMGDIRLEDPVHPHLSMSKKGIAEVQEAYKVIEHDLRVLSRVEEELDGFSSRGGRIGGWPLFSNLIKIIKETKL